MLAGKGTLYSNRIGYGFKDLDKGIRWTNGLSIPARRIPSFRH